MKLVFIASNLTGHGGTETVLIKVLNHLASQNNVYLVMTNYSRDQTWLDKFSPSVKIIEPKSSSKATRLWILIRTFLTASPDTVFIMLGANAIHFAVKIKKFFHKKWLVVSWIHFSLKFQNFFDPHQLIGADEHLAISSAIQRSLNKMGIPKKKIQLILNPISRQDVLPFYKDNEKIRLIYVGRVQYKGQKQLKDLLGAVGRMQNVYLDVYGSGLDLQKCQQACRDFADRVVWHGWVQQPWKKIQTSPDALILPSLFEGLPMVMLEAMSRGIPCVSSRFDGYDDVLKEDQNGFSYDLGDINQLIEKIHQVKQHHFNRLAIANSINCFYDNEYYQRWNKLLQSWKNQG